MVAGEPTVEGRVTVASQLGLLLKMGRHILITALMVNPDGMAIRVTMVKMGVMEKSLS
jgi:hypothetical protein